ANCRQAPSPEKLVDNQTRSERSCADYRGHSSSPFAVPRVTDLSAKVDAAFCRISTTLPRGEKRPAPRRADESGSLAHGQVRLGRAPGHRLGLPNVAVPTPNGLSRAINKSLW